VVAAKYEVGAAVILPDDGAEDHLRSKDINVLTHHLMTLAQVAGRV
jgi:hypothetical protein